MGIFSYQDAIDENMRLQVLRDKLQNEAIQTIIDSIMGEFNRNVLNKLDQITIKLNFTAGWYGSVWQKHISLSKENVRLLVYPAVKEALEKAGWRILELKIKNSWFFSCYKIKMVIGR